MEHLIYYVDEPFVVRSVSGVVLSKGGEWPEQVQVLFEIRGPNGVDKVRGTRLNSGGRFKIDRVRPGKYAFKATASGWQSTVGTIIVTNKAEPNATIRIVMPLGV